MQHIEIHDPSNCTIVNVDAGAERSAPGPETARTCLQCEKPTWRLTPRCMHCGYDRWARYRIAATTAAGAAAVAMVIFHPLS